MADLSHCTEASTETARIKVEYIYSRKDGVLGPRANKRLENALGAFCYKPHAGSLGGTFPPCTSMCLITTQLPGTSHVAFSYRNR